MLLPIYSLCTNLEIFAENSAPSWPSNDEKGGLVELMNAVAFSRSTALSCGHSYAPARKRRCDRVRNELSRWSQAWGFRKRDYWESRPQDRIVIATRVNDTIGDAVSRLLILSVSSLFAVFRKESSMFSRNIILPGLAFSLNLFYVRVCGPFK